MVTFTDMLDGYRRFRETGWANQRARWDELADGQSPRVMIIACSDSRVEPAQIFDTNPGEIFVVRNVAALVPPYETNPGRHGVSAAVEFAVQVLGVEEIVVMGHGLCGGCKAALTRELHDAPIGEGGFIASWISMLDDARGEVVARYGTDQGRIAGRAMEQAAVKVSLENLRTFPWIREKEARSVLSLKGAFFAISDGVLHMLDETTDAFQPYE
ncbi:carbonic anhydrase [Sphingobium nicotianae]|uniref:Carbonic anhydrase n=1 Tax=Sphingobium nicotianae TaxID=2782607 RepID=A0A9X1AIV8_9SPHN|nr:carbonic anhydrase [Sphingobium nicotianae]MBT2185575.1 carbonic anhydrase [Sphingobium nicotianae]